MRGTQSFLVSDNIGDINKEELILGKIQNFSPEFAAASGVLMQGGPIGKDAANMND